ncbi:hypothetical protein ACFQE0_18710 [Methylobacterium komagatae]|uniref:AlgX/AlgJ SGNH hydrolase-like domain-containing protein n=1 Tax=Methylobacterium komagatae TaxID=374425 RepID=A0ABW2BMW2_9HYPH
MTYLTPDVFEGKDGHLFLALGSNNVVGLFSERHASFDSLLRDWRSLIEGRARKLADMGVVYKHIFVPDKLTIYREEAGDLWQGLKSPVEFIENAGLAPMEDIIVPLCAYLRKQKSSYPIFFKNDTHWTPEGCFSAYQMLCAYLSIPHRADLISNPFGRVELSGDLGGKLNPPRTETFRFGSFGRSATRVSANRLVTLRESGALPNGNDLHVGSIVEFRNIASSTPLRVLLFGDSFSEYRNHYLTGLLADTVSELKFVWSTNIDYGVVERFRPNIVISEIAERFMCRIPTDDVDIERHAEKKVETALQKAR